MRLAVYIVAVLLLIPAVSRSQDRLGAKTRPPSKLHRELATPPYTFDRYIADLKDSARKDEAKPVNPVTEEESKNVAANKYRDYKPLNPFVVEW